MQHEKRELEEEAHMSDDRDREVDGSHVTLTVAVPTFNRAAMLRQSLESILAQEGVSMRVVVLDNASTDDTPSVVAGYRDPRLSLNRSPKNVGLLRNWNRCISVNRSEFLCVFCDDDLMRPGFLLKSMRLLEANPDVGFCFSSYEVIDGEGATIPSTLRDVPGGVMDGSTFLEYIASGRGFTMFPSTVVYRASALAYGGGQFDSPHSKFFDTHLWYRMARSCSVGYINEPLVAVREHEGQESEAIWRRKHSIGFVGLIAERLDAVAYLLESPRARDDSYRRWLTQRFLALHKQETEAIHDNAPGSYYSWEELVEIAKDEILEAIPPGSGFILVDEAEWGLEGDFEGRRVWPFTERNGVYWGPPDEATAVEELERLRAFGAEFIVFPWSAFYWLDHYTELNDYLQRRRCLLQNSRLLIFGLEAMPESVPAAERGREPEPADPTHRREVRGHR